MFQVRLGLKDNGTNSAKIIGIDLYFALAWPPPVTLKAHSETKVLKSKSRISSAPLTLVEFSVVGCRQMFYLRSGWFPIEADISPADVLMHHGGEIHLFGLN